MDTKGKRMYIICICIICCIFLTVCHGTDDWGPWTDWSICSKTCDTGVAYRQRVCHNVQSKESCNGTSKQFRVCHLSNCTSSPEGTKECSQQNSKIFGGKQFTWEPIRNPYKRCELSCKAKGQHYYSHLQKLLSDGTPCKPDNSSFCLAGVCMSIGCDGILGSDARIDRCGVCDGNGASCQIVSGIFTRQQLTKYGHNFVTKIPKGACNINITEMSNSRNYIALKVNNKYILNKGQHRSRTGRHQGAGTEFRYYKNTGTSCPGECIYSSGPTNHSIEVEIIYYHRNPGIIYQFTIPHDQVNELGIPSEESKSHHQSLKNGARRRKNRRHHRKHSHRKRNKHKASEDEADEPTLPEEQQDEEVSDDRGRSRRLNNKDRYIIRRRIDADRLNPRIQFGQSPRYIPNVRRGFQQQVLGSYTNHHQNQLSSSHSATDSYNRLNRQSVISRTGQYIVPRTSIPSGSGLVLSNQNQYTNNYNNQVLKPHDRNLIDTTGLYSWRISGFTECSRSCGGGIQESRVLCMRGYSNVEVTEENCDPNTKPKAQTVECNKTPCPADWFVGNWTSCSVTCGAGKKTRLVECRRRISPTLQISVSASLCLHNNKPQRTQRCNNEPCASWKTGNWSKCSTECGHGQRTREVTCIDISGQKTSSNNCAPRKPSTKEICDMGSCAKGWYHSRWSEECSSKCGRGYHTRKIYCAADDGSSLPERKCPVAKKPKTRKTCKNAQPCGGNWFTGPWTGCNATCGVGVKTRGVVCMKNLRSDVYTIVKDENCLAEDKPISEESCGELPPCGATWYMTEFSQCSKSCGTGIRRREVKCLTDDLRPSLTCDKSTKPAERQSCNKESCERSRFSVQKDSRGDDCKDVYASWCQFVRQARICGYNYYKKQCCQSCFEYL